ncbi:kinase [Lithospermum erythrorhizon]|uniref:Kinase n=1 Tax=Lithospermum erythrorhizon TaxID=34254 RepID=A0AAV3R1M4_LITER
MGMREQALPLIAAVNNHGDVAALEQFKNIIISAEPHLAVDFLPYLVDLQSSPQPLVRKYLLEVIEDIAMNRLEHSSILMSILLTLLKDYDPLVAKQAIITGTHIFSRVLEELSLQFHRHLTVERWLNDLWIWMVKFKDAVPSFLFKDGRIGPKLLAVKFLETYILLFTEDANDSDKHIPEALERHRQTFNISWLVGHHPVLDAAVLSEDANKTFNLLMDLLRSARSVPPLFTISIINSLTTIARKRPVHYNSVLSALFEFNSNFEVSRRGHTVSIQYSVRTALLGFLKCTHPMIIESRERLLKALRAMNAGKAADHVIRQVEKMMENYEPASRDAQSNKDEQVSDCPASRNLIKKRPLHMSNEDLSTSNDIASKRTRYLPNHVATSIDDPGLDHVNGVSLKISLLDNDLTPVEQMIFMIGDLLTRGESGVQSLEMVLTKIPPDMLADIVITNMKHLPRNPHPESKLSKLSFNQSNDSSGAAQVVRSVSCTSPVQIPITSSQTRMSTSSDMSTSIDPTSDSKRDPRRDPRCLDPRRSAAPVGVNNDYIGSACEFPPNSTTGLNSSTVQAVPSKPDDTVPPTLDKSHSGVSTPIPEIMVDILVPKIEHETNTINSTEAPEPEIPAADNEIKKEENEKSLLHMEIKEPLEGVVSSSSQAEEGTVEEMMDIIVAEELYSPSFEETEQLSPEISSIEASEDACVDLPMLPAFVELTEEHDRNIERNAIERIIDSDKNFRGTACKHTRTALLARLAIQIVDDADLVTMIQKHIISDYKQQKGDELVVDVLYHLYTLMESDSVDNFLSPASFYEKFLIGVVKSLLDAMPATDKSIGRLLGEVPWLPVSVMKLLEDVCSESHFVKDGRDGDRVTQGLGAVWGLILTRPHDREALLDIALKCAAHPEDGIRTKAIRLVANKLFVLSSTSGRIEEFARSKFLLATDQRGLDKELSQSGIVEHRMDREVGSLETSLSGCQVSEPVASEDEFVKTIQLDSQSVSLVTFDQAQSLVSLYFALCTKVL